MGISVDPRETFAQELETMLRTMPFEKVRVNSLVAQCSASRTTFYRYFRDKHDIVSWVYDRSYEALVSERFGAAYMTNASRTWQAMGELVFYAIMEKPRFYKAVIGYSGQNSFIEHFVSYNTSCFCEHLKHELRVRELPSDMSFCVLFYYAGLAYIVKQWILTGMKETPEEMQKICERNIPNIMMEHLLLLEQAQNRCTGSISPQLPKRCKLKNR